MLKNLNHIVPDLLLEPNFRFLRHFLIFMAVALITANVLWDEPTTIIAYRYWAWAVYFLLFKIVIYTNMYGLVPKLLLQGKARQYVLSTIALMLFFLVSVGLLQSIADHGSTPARTPQLIGITSGFATFLLFIIGLTALQFFKYSVKNQQKISQLEKATMEVELANLQNQINPHFLFNMLNNANILVEEDAERSSEILTRLNALLQYQVEKSSERLVSLKEDIVLLKDYLELEKLRRDRFSYSIYSDENNKINLPPLLFIPFVENAVKHNPENDAFVSIVFHTTANNLRFECRNNKPKSPVVKKEGGIGLVNIRQRLNLLFGEKHMLQLTDEQESYTVIMEIEL